MSETSATVTVALNSDNQPNRSYDIAIASHSLKDLGSKLVEIGLGKKSKKALIVSNPVIYKHYGDTVQTSLSNAGFDVAHLILPAGERFKTANSLQKIYDDALEHRLERSSVIIALGGGVIGDMSGYAAATWLRGIDLVQVPTTLLAMVDSAIGGKTGINHPQGKNLIGAFYQPRLVWIDPAVLKTLPAREFRSAMAEVIKYGVIWDRELFDLLAKCDRLDQLRYISDELLQTILYRCAKAKAEVVSKDEKEGNLRAILNYGHTVGHSIESVTNYRIYNHGEAVGLGMIIAGAIAVDLGLWSAEEQAQQISLITKTRLPQTLPTDIDQDAIVESLSTDKKVEAGKVRFILPTAIGNVTLSDRVTGDLVKQNLRQLLA
ncbi:3-dehydroquinate synthase [Pseudanabaena sp. FACHB-1998]|uniref:3-dehydroquinate synthase n=1 Tax=Pseudanabaena sp. FACHB-1998 TaxID=2692858 RepID=UPI001680A0C2|nr:3-dehydroquinate synthase [Pseudanabaena sp. FACHB-1998]MBD2176519.1 3-dehydroquinate synthase [Pseudanabaena sp. FACHB-1998]